MKIAGFIKHSLVWHFDLSVVECKYNSFRKILFTLVITKDRRGTKPVGKKNAASTCCANENIYAAGLLKIYNCLPRVGRRSSIDSTGGSTERLRLQMRMTKIFPLFVNILRKRNLREPEFICVIFPT